MITGFLITILAISGATTLTMFLLKFTIGEDFGDIKGGLPIAVVVFVLSSLAICCGYNSNIKYRQIPVSFVGDTAVIADNNGKLINLNRRFHCNFKEGDTIVVRTSHCGPVEFFSIGISNE